MATPPLGIGSVMVSKNSRGPCTHAVDLPSPYFSPPILGAVSKILKAYKNCAGFLFLKGSVCLLWITKVLFHDCDFLDYREGIP